MRNPAPCSLWRLRGAAIVALALLALVAAPARAQQPPPFGADIVSISDGDYPAARAVINVEDASGGDIGGLTADDVTVTVDGQPAAVSSADLASSQNLPLDVLFVMDVSGSMAGAPIAGAKEAAKAFLAGLAPADRVAVLSFADEPRLVQDFTVDRGAALAAIDGLKASGNTALYQATSDAAAKVAASASSRRAVIFLSDGAQDGVQTTVARDQAIILAAGSGVPFFTIGEGSNIDRGYLQQLAGITKGRYLEAPSPNDLASLYAGIGRLLQSQYVVTFDASSVAADGSAVAITLTSAGRSATATANYKPGPSFAPPPPVIEGVQAGDDVSSARSITATSTGGKPATRAVFYLDGVNVFETTTSPFTYTFDPARVAGGSHTLKVVVESGARSSEASVAFSSTPPPESAAGGLPLVPVAAGAGVLLAVVAALVFVLRRRASRRASPDAKRLVAFAKPLLPGMPPPPPDEEEEPPAPESIGEPAGILISRGGPSLGSEYTVGSSPVSIGSAARCGVRVDDPDLGAEEARIWIHNGHLMVHRMTRLTTMVEDGTTGGWVILEPGETFDIGPHKFEFRLLPQPRPAGPDDGADVPNVLRDPDMPRRPLPPSMQPQPFADVAPRDGLDDDRRAS